MFSGPVPQMVLLLQQRTAAVGNLMPTKEAADQVGAPCFTKCNTIQDWLKVDASSGNRCAPVNELVRQSVG